MRVALPMTSACALVLTTLAGTAPAVAGAGHHDPDGHHASPSTASHPAAHVDRTVLVEARDVEFDLATLEVAAGETIRFVVTNRGDFPHDFTLGDPDTQHAHREVMASMMEEGETGHHGSHGHGQTNAIMLQPGETKELVWTFAPADAFEFACNIPGHYESGMMGVMEIEPRIIPASAS
jgi:uncharacterized cupredoxin-like copper-binding protein